MIYGQRLREITGETVKGWYDWLVGAQCGCCHVRFADGRAHAWSVCMGWHDPSGAGREWRVAWKIGRQAYDNAMQTDLDVDFEMPYDPETGEVDDTLEVLDPPPDGDAEWDELAASMREQAVSTYKRWEDD